MPHVRAPDGALLHWDELPGEGAPVALAHGVLDAPDAWRAVADALRAAGRRVLVPHARGHGASQPWASSMDWTPQRQAADLAVVLEAAAPEGAHVVGHSRGGTAAGWLAVERPDLVRSLAVVASPPQPGEAFRAAFRRRLADARDEREREALRYLAAIPDDDFPQHALRRHADPALVVEAGDDPLYSPMHTMFWRMFLPYAAFERVEGGHRFFVSGEGAAWLARRLLAHVEDAERGRRNG